MVMLQLADTQYVTRERRDTALACGLGKPVAPTQKQVVLSYPLVYCHAPNRLMGQPKNSLLHIPMGSLYGHMNAVKVTKSHGHG